MNASADALYHAALALPVEDRVSLAERLFESVDQAELDAAWAVEAEARISAHEQGNMKAMSADEAHGLLPPR